MKLITFDSTQNDSPNSYGNGDGFGTGWAYGNGSSPEMLIREIKYYEVKI